ncbi:NACHT domain-containing protein [Alteromonas sp. a30]|uniref:NACHT domain-containing protein n=1 Tax=Alteromonas sp. a30 TaxID=2730917 RepID=UPI0022802F41|nr:hypothetical protein [Alteromonas sp. a30]MCY7296891.1 ATP-binding protein [Alteromonas sp. a30]
MIERKFQSINLEDSYEDNQKLQWLFGISYGGITWGELLQSSRVLIVSEAGAGKTYECQKQREKLWDAGQTSFFIELADLCRTKVEDLLDNEEEERLKQWLASPDEVATFFLDSFDELKLTRGSFDKALKALKKSIKDALHRVRLVITSRPIPFDLETVEKLFPIKSIPSLPNLSAEDSFVAAALGSSEEKEVKSDKESNQKIKVVALKPFSDSEIVDFAKLKGVKDTEDLLSDLNKKHALEFARRPQDLLEICSTWTDYGSIRNHCDQVRHNIETKLSAREDRQEWAELSLEKSIEGAQRLALATVLTRRITIRHGPESDKDSGVTALDPSKVLQDWNTSQIKTLLERPLFGFASYGRVRFHHRSVTEYLAACCLNQLRKQSMTHRTLIEILASYSKDRYFVRASRRAIGGWLAVWDDDVYEFLLKHEPETLLNEGDPQSLTQQQRNRALETYINKHGRGGDRGRDFPYIQVHRFASPELASVINPLWEEGIASFEIRKLILELIAFGKISKCVNIAYESACSKDAGEWERLVAIEALVSNEDSRLASIAHQVCTAADGWPDAVARRVVAQLFPRHLTVNQLGIALGWLADSKSSRVDDLVWQLPKIIDEESFSYEELEALRDRLVDLISEGLTCVDSYSHLLSSRAYLSSVLAQVCVKGLALSRDDKWLYASVLAQRTCKDTYRQDDSHTVLQSVLEGFEAKDVERYFWATDCLLESLAKSNSAWDRCYSLYHYKFPTPLEFGRDINWIRSALSNSALPQDKRVLLIEVIYRIHETHTTLQYLEKIKPLVSDDEFLVNVITKIISNSSVNENQSKWKRRQEQQKQEQHKKEMHKEAHWRLFFQQVVEQPEKMFSEDCKLNTIWGIWSVMDGGYSKGYGWNRCFLDKHFSPELVEKVRLNMLQYWRTERPTLPSERAKEERNSYCKKWLLGLAGVYAEAESHNWAKNLTPEEVKLAARYSIRELNGLPNWLEALVESWPREVDSILGEELTWELSLKDSGIQNTHLLHSVSRVSKRGTFIFIPRLLEWLKNCTPVYEESEDFTAYIHRLRTATITILKSENAANDNALLNMAEDKLKRKVSPPEALIWLTALLRIAPDKGVDALEQNLEALANEQNNIAVGWFAALFDRHNDNIGLKKGAFSPQTLLKLTKLAYTYVKEEDDVTHEGRYTPGARDDAQSARDYILGAVLDLKGESGFNAKLALSRESFCASFKDRIITRAEDNWANELDSNEYSEKAVNNLISNQELPVTSNSAMFSLLCSRLEFLDDLLLGSFSPQDSWSKISSEKLMRREIARVLHDAENGLYKTSQEEVTGDEKETDIRLKSTHSEHEGIIELKLGENWSGKQLKDTIKQQLVCKYLRPRSARTGVLLVTVSDANKRWKHPENNKLSLDMDGLKQMLESEAKEVEKSMDQEVYIIVHVLDLKASSH